MKPSVSEISLIKDNQQSWAKQVIHGKYFPHIDGLRCLAVIPVVLYHLKMGLCPAGFLGVDIFFVISGYLICGGIVRDLQNGTFSLRSFYYRRIRRIFPAYFALVLGVLIVGVFLFHWARIVPLAKTSLFSIFFSTNIYFWLDMGYFQPNALDNPLLNLWSLGVEEHFYIIIPVASLLLWKIWKNSLRIAFLLCFVASLILCVILGHKGESTTAFYILPTRAWELLAGALLAGVPRPKCSLRSDLLSLLGFVLILLSFFWLSTANTSELSGTRIELIAPFIGSLGFYPFPGLVTLPVIMGSLLLLHYGEGVLASRILCSRPFVGIGKISYSLYLWHWPLIVFSRYINYNRSEPITLVGVFLISLVVAYLSWLLVEMPFRLNGRFTPRTAFASTGLGCAALALLCIFLIRTDGLRSFFHQQANIYAYDPRPFMPNLNKFWPKQPFRPPSYPLLDGNYLNHIGVPGQKPTFCVVGDSHTEAIAPGLEVVATEHQQSGIQVTLKMHPFVQNGSDANPQRILNWLANNPDICDVYLVGRWLAEYRVYTGMPQLGDKYKIKPYSLDDKTAETIEDSFRRTALFFGKHGKRVFVFTTVPEYDYSPTDIMARSQIIPLNLPIEITRDDYINRQDPISKIFSKLEEEGLITIIPSGSTLLSGDKTVFMSKSGQPYYKDGNHITPEGACYVCRKIAPLLWSRDFN
jgi:peptidoglycan/LPS O-acetylase OafA/YrhL